jgi:hypothetical protein
VELWASWTLNFVRSLDFNILPPHLLPPHLLPLHVLLYRLAFGSPHDSFYLNYLARQARKNNREVETFLTALPISPVAHNREYDADKSIVCTARPVDGLLLSALKDHYATVHRTGRNSGRAPMAMTTVPPQGLAGPNQPLSQNLQRSMRLGAELDRLREGMRPAPKPLTSRPVDRSHAQIQYYRENHRDPQHSNLSASTQHAVPGATAHARALQQIDKRCGSMHVSNTPGASTAAARRKNILAGVSLLAEQPHSSLTPPCSRPATAGSAMHTPPTPHDTILAQQIPPPVLPPVTLGYRYVSRQE